MLNNIELNWVELINDTKLIDEFKQLCKNEVFDLYKVLKSIFTFDSSLWKTDYIFINYILSMFYGCMYYSIIVGTFINYIG